MRMLQEFDILKGTKLVMPSCSETLRTFRMLFTMLHLIKTFCKIRTLLSSNLYSNKNNKTVEHEFHNKTHHLSVPEQLQAGSSSESQPQREPTQTP